MSYKSRENSMTFSTAQGQAPAESKDAYSFMIEHLMPRGLRGVVAAALLATGCLVEVEKVADPGPAFAEARRQAARRNHRQARLVSGSRGRIQGR